MRWNKLRMDANELVPVQKQPSALRCLFRSAEVHVRSRRVSIPPERNACHGVVTHRQIQDGECGSRETSDGGAGKNCTPGFELRAVNLVTEYHQAIRFFLPSDSSCCKPESPAPDWNSQEQPDLTYSKRNAGASGSG